MKNRKQFTLRLSTEQLETLKDLAEKEDRTVSAIIRRMINEKTINTEKTKRTSEV